MNIPIPGKPEPFQLPHFYDPSSIIMQAAALRQQRDLQQQQINQNAVRGLVESIQAAQSLQEQKREAQSRESIAQATLAMQQGKLPLEEAQLQAHTGLIQSQQKLAEAQASMYGNTGTSNLFQQIHSGQTPPSIGFGAYSSRNGQKAAIQNLYMQAYPNDNLGTLEADYQQKVSGAKTMGQQGPTIQKIDSLFPQINRFDKLASLVPKGTMDALNRYGLQAAAAGIPGLDPSVKVHAANLLQQTKILADEAQSTFGTGSDAKLALGTAIFDPNPNPAALMSNNQIARYSLLSRRNALAGQSANFQPPTFNSAPPTETVSSYLGRMRSQGIPAQSVIPVVHQMVQSGLLDDDISGGGISGGQQ